LAISDFSWYSAGVKLVFVTLLLWAVRIFFEDLHYTTAGFYWAIS